jgi:glyoxylase-like metal-dependent hydrolase (beta-lactamase superfamily II)
LLVVMAIGPAPLLYAEAPCVADCAPAGGNGLVNIDDLLAVINAFGSGPSSCDIAPDNGDGTFGNGEVNIDDVLATINAFGPCPAIGTFPATWINGGPNCGTEPSIQVHAFNEDFYILRQSLCTNFEAPFMYLLFGEDKVLLQDTGAGGILIAATVYDIIDAWLIRNGKASIELVVTHSHGHGDHVAGNSQFNGQPNTTVVGNSQASVANLFGITTWPTQIVEYDLGGRIIDIVPIPGHQSSHIALYDRATDILFTGDTLYPGRCYISDFPTYVTSIRRLVNFVDGKPVCWVLGTHIEMTTTPGVDYGFGVTSHPNEHVLQLTRDHLLELHDGVIAMQNAPFIEVHDDFIIYPLNPAFSAFGRSPLDASTMHMPPDPDAGHSLANQVQPTSASSP